MATSKKDRFGGTIINDTTITDRFGGTVVGDPEVKKKASSVVATSPSKTGFQSPSPYALPSVEPQSPLQGNDLLNFMSNPGAEVARKNVESKIITGQEIVPNDIKQLKSFAPEAFTNLKNSTGAKKFVADNPADQLTFDAERIAKTINARVAEIDRPVPVPPRDIIAADIDKNFPALPASAGNILSKPFSYPQFGAVDPGNPLSPTKELTFDEQRTKVKEEILNDPYKQAQYLFRRQQAENEKTAAAQAELQNLETGSNFNLSSNQGYQDAKQARQTAEKQNALSQTVSQTSRQSFALKQLASEALSAAVINDYVKENNIDNTTEEGKRNAITLLATDKAKSDIGFRVKAQSDAQFAGNVSDIYQSRIDDKSNIASGNIAQMALGYLRGGDNEIDSSQTGMFKSLSETGNEKIQQQINLEGHGLIKQYFKKEGNTEGLGTVQSQDEDVAVKNGKAVTDELWVRLSSQRYKDAGNKIVIGNSGVNAESMRTLANNAGFNETELQILDKYMIPDEMSRSMTSNFQTSGFVNNFYESLGGVAVNVGNSLRSDAARVQETFNENAGRLEDIGQYSPFLAELTQLEDKKKNSGLNGQEQKRIQLLEDNTNLLNQWQKLKSGSGNLTGQVVGQAVLASAIGGIGGLLARAGAVSVGGATEAAAVIGGLGNAATDIGIVESVVATGFDAAANGIANNVINAPGVLAKLGTKVGNYARENANLFISSYSNAYDGYAKEALQILPGAENSSKRVIYTNMMSTFEGLSEKIFDDRKVLNSLGAEINPLVREIVQDIGSNSISRAASIGKIQSVLLGGNYKPFLKKLALNSNQEGVEEAITDLAGDIAKSIVLNQDYDVTTSIAGALKTYGTMVMDGALTAGMAARGDVRNNTFNKTTMYHVATNSSDYTDEVNRLAHEGEITNEQAQEKKLVINTTAQAYANMVKDGVVDKNEKNDAKNAQYLLHTVNEAVNKEKARQATDEVVKNGFEKEAARSRAIREGIYNGTINVDAFLNPVTANPKLATELNIDNEGTTTQAKVGEPATANQTIPKEQGTESAVSGNAIGTGQGNAAIPTTLLATEIRDAKVEGVTNGTDEEVINYAIDKAAEDPAKFQLQHPGIFDKVVDKIPTEKLQSNLDFLLANNSENPSVDVLDKIIADREEAQKNTAKTGNGDNVTTAKNILSAQEQKEVFDELSVKEKVAFSKAKKNGEGDNFLLNVFNEKNSQTVQNTPQSNGKTDAGVIRNESITTANADTVNPTGVDKRQTGNVDQPNQETTAATEFKVGDKVNYQGTPHTIGEVVSIPNSGNKQYQLLDESGKPLNSESGKKKYVLGSSIQGENVSNSNDNSFQLTDQAKALLKKVDEGGLPAFVTANLKKIASDNGVEVTPKMNAKAVVDAIRAKGNEIVEPQQTTTVPVVGEVSAKDKKIIDAHNEIDGYIEKAQNDYDNAQAERLAFIKKYRYGEGDQTAFDKLVSKKVEAEDKLNRLKTAKENLLPLPTEPIQSKVEDYSFDPKETQYAALDKLTKGIAELPKDQQQAEIERRAILHDKSYQQFIKTGSNKINAENKLLERVQDFGKLTAKAMQEFISNPKKYEGQEEVFKNGSRLDEKGKVINENDFVTLKEQVKKLRAEKNIAEIDKINAAPSTYLETLKNKNNNEPNTDQTNSSTNPESIKQDANIEAIESKATDAENNNDQVAAQSVIKEAETTLAKANIFITPISSLSADPARFQPRKQKSKLEISKFADKILSANSAFHKQQLKSRIEKILATTTGSFESIEKILNSFDANNLDALKTWVDPKDGKTYVANHSRLAAHQILSILPSTDERFISAIANGFEKGMIVTQATNYKTEQEFKDAAQLSNNQSAKNTITEDANIIRGWAKEGLTKKQTKERADKEFGKNSPILLNIAALNPNGRTIQFLESIDGSTDKETANKAEQIANWVGNAMANYPLLTREHENEMFDFLLSNDSKRISDKAGFISKVSSLVNGFDFDASKPLNIKRFKQETQGETAYNEKYAELQNEISDRQSQIDAIKERFNNPKLDGYVSTDDPQYDDKKSIADTKIADLNAQLKGWQQKIQDLQREKGKYQSAATTGTLFNALPSQNKIEQDANDIITGKKIFERFSQEEQRGFAEGGQIHAEASLIVGTSEGAGIEPEIQEQEIEKYSKEKGVWVDNTDTSLREQYGEPISTIGKDSQEATVWLDGNNVVKAQSTSMYGYDLQQKLDGITLHNSYFPEAPLKVIGFGRDANGEFQVIVEQPFVNGTKLTPDEINQHLNKIGFEKEVDNNQFTDKNNQTIIEDVHTGNAIRTPEGNIVVIDPIMRLNTPEQGYGGTREVSNKISDSKSAFEVGEAKVEQAKVQKIIEFFEKVLKAKVFAPLSEFKNKLNELGYDSLVAMVEAWHGSPHAFNNFSLDKIGTGEGAQAFGHGLYFTDVKSIADTYAEQLAKKSIKEMYDRGDEMPKAAYDALKEVDFLGYDDEWQAADTFYKRTKKTLIDGWDISEEEYNKINNALLGGKRNLYKVSLHEGKTAEQYDWLVWDSNISDAQLNKIKKGLDKLGVEYKISGIDGVGRVIQPKGTEANLRFKTGSDVYSAIKNLLRTDKNNIGTPKEASDFLLSTGIDGVKYPAESLARGTNSDNARGFNYVVFDEKAVTIKEQVQFIATPAGKVLGFVSNGKIYLNPETLNANTTFHELIHIQQALIKTASLQGDKQAAEILSRFDKLLNVSVDKIKAGEKVITLSGVKIDLSNEVYNKSKNESEADYTERLRNELWAYLQAPENSKKWDNATHSAVKNFLNSVREWFISKLGLKNAKDIQSLTLEQLIDRTSDSLIRGEYNNFAQAASQTSFAISPSKLKSEIDELRKEGLTDEEIQSLYSENSTVSEEELSKAMGNIPDANAPKTFGRAAAITAINTIGVTSKGTIYDSIINRKSRGFDVETSDIKDKNATDLGLYQHTANIVLQKFKDSFGDKYLAKALAITRELHNSKSKEVGDEQLLSFGIALENEIGAIRDGFVDNEFNILPQELSRINSSIQNLNKVKQSTGSALVSLSKNLYNWYGLKNQGADALFTPDQLKEKGVVEDVLNDDEAIADAADAFEEEVTVVDAPVITPDGKKKPAKKSTGKVVRDQIDAELKKLKEDIDKLNC